MTVLKQKALAVIFVSQRNGDDEQGYAAAAEQMVALAAQQPGYLGSDSSRDAAGLGITVSYWHDDASAHAWKMHPKHAEIRDAGRAKWYDWYDLHVAEVIRSYDWKSA